jgi:molybdopterin-guanine dinucleotide biosynthesis protein A
MSDVAGFVTAGGRSSRMGKDKAWLELAGRPMIEHVIAALQPVTCGVSIIANDSEYQKLGLPVFPDSHGGIGPLEAIRISLLNTKNPRALLVGCDLPFVTSELFKFLVSLDGPNGAVVPMSANQKLEPLCAIYCTSAVNAVENLIAIGERKISLLYDRVPTRFVRFEELQQLAGSELFFRNINTPGDYAQAIKDFNKTSSIGLETTSR